MSNTVSFELPSTPTGYDSGGGKEIPIDVKALVGIVYKRFWMIATSVIVVFSWMAFITFSQTPIYRASSVVIVDSNQLNVINLGAVLGGAALSTPALDTEVRVMKSKTMLRRVALAENLVTDPEFNPALRDEKPSLFAPVSNFINGLFSPAKAPAPRSTPLTPEQRQEQLVNRATGILMGKVNVERVGTTYLMRITVTSESPHNAARLANAIADQYRVNQMEAKLEATQRATVWLSERVSVLRDDLAAKENAVEQFRNSTGLLSAQGSSLTESNIAMLQQQKVQLEAQLTRARSRYNNMRRQIESGAGVDSIAEVLDSQVISNLKSQRATVQRRVAELQSTFGPRHPDLVAALGEDADIQRQIMAEVERIASSVESEVRVAEEQLGRVNAQLSQNRSQLIQDNSSIVRLRELERDAEASRAIYEEFINRFKETSEQDDLIEADARILSEASVPNSPSAPRTKLNLFIGIMLGGVIGGLLALIAEIFDSKISSSDELERGFNVKSLGTIPLINQGGLLGFGKKKPADYLVDNPLSGYAESMRYLRVAVAFSDIDSQTKTVAVTSSLPDEGKTSLTLSLGRMSAMSGAKTIVLDGDFRRRQLTEAAGFEVATGMVEHLFGEVSLDDVIRRDEKSELDILPLSLDGPTPHDVFGTKAFDKLHATLRTKYDLILIDTGPLLLMAEARVIAGKADKTILIVRWRKTTRAVIRKSLNLLKSFRADLLGVVLNMVDIERRRQHNEPGTAYRDYKKYYLTESKPGFRRPRRKPVTSTPKAEPETQPMVQEASVENAETKVEPEPAK